MRVVSEAGEMGTRRGWFTIIELLVVIAIFAILVALLMPALSKARQVANRTACASNMKDLSLAILNYASDNYGSLPPGDVYLRRSKGGDRFGPTIPCYSWDDFLGMGGYDGRLLTRTQAWGQRFTDEKLVSKLYSCPSGSLNYHEFPRSYYANTGDNKDRRKNDAQAGVMGRYDAARSGTTGDRAGWSVKTAEIPDPIGTLLLAESAWVCDLGAPFGTTATDQMDSDMRHGILMRHGPLSGNYGFCDGHVALMKYPETKSPHNMWTRDDRD